MYDLIILGGGTSGCACAYIAGKLGLKTLVIEKNIHLGGSITSGFVTPVMKTETNNLNCEFYNSFVKEMKNYNAQITYSDGNCGWFNPEVAKIVLEKMLFDVNVDILYDCEIATISNRNTTITSVAILHKMLSLDFESKYFVDATGDANFCKKIGHKFLPNENIFQTMSLRFLISGINLEEFKNQIIELDTNREVTNYCYSDGQLHLTTAYTWDDNDWGLKPLFDKAVKNGDLQYDDTAYFQLFTVAGMPGSVSLNCPRLLADRDLDPNNVFDISKALSTGRTRIWRIFNFCKKYFYGFKNAYISNMADMVGIRESRRILGEYIMSEDDIIMPKTFSNPACSSDYPIDVHSKDKNSSVLKYSKQTFTMPIEALKSSEYNNLFAIGRCFSGTFKAQAALRTQANCFSMGEAVAKFVFSKYK